MALPLKIKKYFWDIETSKANPKKNPEYFITRILEMGDRSAFDWLKSIFGLTKIKKTLKTSRLSHKSKNFWQTTL